MDLNSLIHREGVERLRAQQAGSRAAQLSHLALADMYRDRIDFRRRTASVEPGPDRDGLAAAG